MQKDWRSQVIPKTDHISDAAEKESQRWYNLFQWVYICKTR